jgi:hypothetical protein
MQEELLSHDYSDSQGEEDHTDVGGQTGDFRERNTNNEGERKPKQGHRGSSKEGIC